MGPEEFLLLRRYGKHRNKFQKNNSAVEMANTGIMELCNIGGIASTVFRFVKRRKNNARNK